MNTVREYYIAAKTGWFGAHKVKAGDVIPDAETMPKLEQNIRLGRIRRVGAVVKSESVPLGNAELGGE